MFGFLFENLLELVAQEGFQRGTDGALLAGRNGTDGISRVAEGLKRDQFQTGRGVGGIGKELVRDVIGAEAGVCFCVADLHVEGASEREWM